MLQLRLCGHQVTPLLGELRQGDLVGNMEALTRSAAQAAADITRLQGEVCGMPESIWI